MENPKISIIIPVYNVEKYLDKCLDSIINQTYKNIEIICINDSSTDNSESILNKYNKKDSRIRVLNKKNEGVSLARNFALKYVTGEYLMFVDSDDWIELNTCEVAIKIAKKYNTDLVMWTYIREWENNSKIKEIYTSDMLIFDEDMCKNNLHRRMIGLYGNELREPANADALCTVWAKLYKANIIKDNNVIFEDIRKIGTYEDGLFNLEIFNLINKAIFINKGLYHYRKNNINSITQKYKENFFEDWQNLFNILDQYIVTNKCGENYVKALDNRICISILWLGLNICNSDKGAIYKISEIKRIINCEIYRKAYKDLKLTYFPLKWKIFYGAAKYNSAICLYLLLITIKKLIGRE